MHHKNIDILNQDQYEPSPHSVRSVISKFKQSAILTADHQLPQIELSNSKKQMLEKFKKSVAYLDNKVKNQDHQQNSFNLTIQDKKSDKQSLNYSQNSQNYQNNDIVDPNFRYSQQDYQKDLNANKLLKDNKQKTTQKEKRSIEKKVKVETPETIEDLVKIKQNNYKQLCEAIKILTEQTKFIKYCYNKEMTQQISVIFSPNFQFMMCKSKPSVFDCLIPKKIHTIFLMKSLTNILIGLKTNNFQRYIHSNYQISQSNAVSIILKNRTIDLIACSEEARDIFVKSIKIVKSYL